ncbi:MAG TPA: peptide-binding protein [Burkholderiales bacterium]
MLKNLLTGLLRGNGTRRRDFLPTDDGDAVSTELREALRLLSVHDYAHASELCERLLRHDSGMVRAWEILGAIALGLGDCALACERFERAVALAGDDPQLLANAAEASRRAGRFERALELSQRALALQPDHAASLHARVFALEACWRSDEALEACREAIALQPDFAKLRVSYMMMLNRAAADPALVLEAHCLWGDRFCGAQQAGGVVHRNPPQPQRRLRIGYVSADLCQHAVSHFVLPLLEHHDPADFEVYCYSNAQASDDVTRRCEALAAHWRDIAYSTDQAADELIRADGIDILIDLSGHTAGNRLRLFARRPAPIQITYLGYPATTGLAQMDYRLTDACADPPGASESHYRERLLRLPHCLWCFAPPRQMPEVSALPGARAGHITFGSLNSMFKLTPALVALWARLLRELPASKLVLATVAEGESRRRIAREFEANGIDPARLEFHGFLPRNEFWGLHSRIDLALDSFPCNGGATTCETLWLGVPVVSLAGAMFQSRAGLSILSNVGLAELVAHQPEDYVRIALDLARDPERLAQLRSGMRSRMRASPLLDAPGFTRDFEAACRSAWKQWCEQGPRAGAC